MYERMLDKSHTPSDEESKAYIGENACELLLSLEKELKERYPLERTLVFPFGNHYGWGYKYSYKSSHLCHLFFERGAYTILIQISGKDRNKLEAILDSCLPKSRDIWEQRYPCGEGGWMYYQVTEQEELQDILRFIEIKKKPVTRK